MTATIHEWFGLTYSNYLVLHRSILQSMPEDWQRRFTALVEEINDAMGEGMRDRMPTSYDIRVLARPRERTAYPPCEDCEGHGLVPDPDDPAGPLAVDCPACDGACVDYEASPEYETPEQAGVIDDPVPHYNRGRTRIDFETGLEVRR